MNRGMDRGRGLGIDEAFFCDSRSNLEIDEAFQISQTRPRSRQVVFQKRTRYSIDFEEYTHPAQQPNPPKNARFVGFMEILGTYGQHVHPKSEVRGHPTPYPPQPPPPSSPAPTSLLSETIFQRQYF